MKDDAPTSSALSDPRGPALGEIVGALVASPESPFIVMRNGEGLPDVPSGSDIDLLLRPGVSLDTAISWIRAEATRLGWSYGFENYRSYMHALALFKATDGEYAAVHLDLFDGVTLYGVPLLSGEALNNEIVSRSGMATLSLRAETLVTVIHRLAWSGGLVKAKYRAQLKETLGDPSSRDWLIQQLKEAIGPQIASVVMAQNALARRSTWRRMRILMYVFRKNLSLDLPATLLSMFSYVRSQLETAFRPTGIVGQVGDLLPGSDSIHLSLALACRLEPHSFYAPHVRAPADEIQTTNGPAYESYIRRSWRRAAALRWTVPSLFLWYQRKRGEIVLLDRLPLGPRLFRRLFRTAGGAGAR